MMRPIAVIDPACPQPRRASLDAAVHSLQTRRRGRLITAGAAIAGLLALAVCALLCPQAVLPLAAATLAAAVITTVADNSTNDMRWVLDEDEVGLTAPLAGMRTRGATDQQLWEALRVISEAPDIDGTTLVAALDEDDINSGLAHLNLRVREDARARAQAILAGRA